MANNTALVGATVDKDALAILGASDDRNLMSQGQDDFLPYDHEFTVDVDISEVKAKKNYDSRGVFVTFRVTDSSSAEIKSGKQYVIAFFDAHKNLDEFIISKHMASRRQFAACVEGVDENADYQAAPVLLVLHKEVEPLGIKMRMYNKYQRTTRNGKKIHELRFTKLA